MYCLEREQVGHLHERPDGQPDPLVQHHQLFGDRHVPDGPRCDDHGPRPPKGHSAVQRRGATGDTPLMILSSFFSRLGSYFTTVSCFLLSCAVMLSVLCGYVISGAFWWVSCLNQTSENVSRDMYSGVCTTPS